VSRREDFQKILNHEQPEKLIIDFGGNPLSSMEGQSMYRLLEFLGYDVIDKMDVMPFGRVRRLDERLLKHFGIDTRSVGTILKPQESLYKKISDSEYMDEWGIRRRYTGMYWDIVEYPLKDATVKDLESYQWPDPESMDTNEIEEYTRQAKRLYEETDYVICAEHPVYGIFELGCWMCGFDDFATQTSLFVSPDMFRRLIKPYFKERISYTKKFTQAAYLHHSCGSVFPIIDDLIDCGVDILNPIQPRAKDMQPENLKRTYGKRIVFHGGIDTQEILPFGTKESIEKTVKDTIEIMNRDGGYIFAAAHNIQEDVPPQNLVYMLEAAGKFGKGKGLKNEQD